ncbi:MAG: hypothetical protein LUD72_00740 [Bacteroidales bacterium]|nr:hypothetical protein [Bacteroidales bacterium]
MFEKINEFNWIQAKEKYSNYDQWIFPSSLRGKGLTFLTDESVDFLIKHPHIVIGGDRNSVVVYGENSYLSLEYECRKDNDMAKILTEKMQNKWLLLRNRTVADKILADIKKMGYLYSPLYGVIADRADDIQKTENLYIIYPYVRDTHMTECAWAEIYGFALAECRKYKLPYIYVSKANGESRYVSANDVLLENDDSLIEAFYGNKYNFLLKGVGPSSYNGEMAYTQRNEQIL